MANITAIDLRPASLVLAAAALVTNAVTLTQAQEPSVRESRRRSRLAQSCDRSGELDVHDGRGERTSFRNIKSRGREEARLLWRC